MTHQLNCCCTYIKCDNLFKRLQLKASIWINTIDLYNSTYIYQSINQFRFFWFYSILSPSPKKSPANERESNIFRRNAFLFLISPFRNFLQVFRQLNKIEKKFLWCPLSVTSSQTQLIVIEFLISSGTSSIFTNIDANIVRFISIFVDGFQSNSFRCSNKKFHYLWLRYGTHTASTPNKNIFTFWMRNYDILGQSIFFFLVFSKKPSTLPKTISHRTN